MPLVIPCTKGLLNPRPSHSTMSRTTSGRFYTNLILQSEDFSTSWGNTRTSESVNVIAAPDGTNTADKIIEDGTAAQTHLMSQAVNTVADIHTFSVFCKAAERSRVMLYHAVSNTARIFNLSNGQIEGNAGLAVPIASYISNYGNGWYRCAIVSRATAASNDYRIYLAVSNTGSGNDFNYNGDSVSGIYVWGAQLEKGFGSAYIPTTNTAVTREEP